MENKWIMEVRVLGVKNYLWEAVRPTGGKRYEYDTRLDALRMLNICYPDCIYGETVRVRQLWDIEVFDIK